MKAVQYTSLRSALVDVYQTVDHNFIEEDEILEWASYAMEKMITYKDYQQMLYFTDVHNHRAQLPCGLKYIEQIFYKEILSTEDRQLMMSYLATPDSYILRPVPGFLDREDAHRHRWIPMRLATSTFNHIHEFPVDPKIIPGQQGEFHPDDLGGDMEATARHGHNEAQYSINKDGTITTSIRKGVICIGYLSYPMKGDDFLIPDERAVKDAIKNAVLMKLWEKRMNYKEDGALAMFKEYRAMYEITKAKAIGELMLPGLDEWENIKQNMVRLGQNTNNYYTGFGVLNAGENNLRLQ